MTYQENLIDKTNDDLMKELPHQFYFAEAYDASRKAFVEPPIKAQSMGRLGKVSLGMCCKPFALGSYIPSRCCLLKVAVGYGSDQLFKVKWK